MSYTIECYGNNEWLKWKPLPKPTTRQAWAGTKNYPMRVSCNNCKRIMWCPAVERNTLHYCNKHTTKWEGVKVFPTIFSMDELMGDHE